jgi:hypothetical protein
MFSGVLRARLGIRKQKPAMGDAANGCSQPDLYALLIEQVLRGIVSMRLAIGVSP